MHQRLGIDGLGWNIELRRFDWWWLCSNLSQCYRFVIFVLFVFSLSLFNLEENVDQIYGTMLAKAFISTGIQYNERIIIFSPTIRNKQSRFLNELPIVSQASSSSSAPNDSESMNIAFRYSQLPSRFVDDNRTATATKLDYGQHVSKTIVEDARIEFHNHSQMLQVLEAEAGQSQASSTPVTRVYIDQLGSSLSLILDCNLPTVVYRIKTLLRRLTRSVCLMTLAPELTASNLSPHIVLRIHNQADSLVKIVGFLQSDSSNPYSTDYVGLLHLSRLARLNSFAPYNCSLDSTEFGLKLLNGKRFLVVEKLALPPDLSENVNRFTCAANLG